MRRTLLMVLAVSLTLAAPAGAAVPNWCDICNNNPACYSCCRCEGTSPGECGAGCSLTELAQASTDSLFAPSQCQTSEQLASFEVPSQLAREEVAVDLFLELLDGQAR